MVNPTFNQRYAEDDRWVDAIEPLTDMSKAWTTPNYEGNQGDETGCCAESNIGVGEGGSG